MLVLILGTLSLAVFIYELKKYFNGPYANNQKCMTGKTVVITGGNTGIGAYTVRSLII